MRLVNLVPHYPLALEGLRVAAGARITPGEGNWTDWQVHVRGPRVVLVSPQGWNPGAPKTEWKGHARQMFDIPREHVTIRWEGISAADIDAISKWSPEASVPVLVGKRVDPGATAGPEGALPGPDAAVGAPAEVAPEASTAVEKPKKGPKPPPVVG